jgi:membrane associated rhomboid family serine protease
MIILLPIGHEQLILSKLPFATFVLMALCIVATAVAGLVMWDEDADDLGALLELRAYYHGHDYLDLGPEVVEDLPPRERELYEHRQEWLAWLAEAPDEAAEFVDSIPPEQRRKPAIPMLDSTGEIVEIELGGETSGELDQPRLDALKADFLARAAAVDPETRYEQQLVLDDLAARYASAARSSPARRFAYVPASPSPIGLVTHIFIHAGVIHLVLNLVFLWVVATKLEDLWGRPLFVAAFVVLGVIGALAHGLAHSDSVVPTVGASGSVAGLMGAYVIRLGRTKIRFVYFYFIFRPRAGHFDAPAFLMFPLWFGGELMSALFFDFGTVAYWSHVGGFVAGVVLAMAFKLTDFERRVLGREPEVEQDPDAAPLVAFQRPTSPEPTPEPARSQSLVLREASIESLGKDRLTCSSEAGGSFELERGQVAVVAAAQVGQIAGPLAERWLGATEPRTGTTVLLVLLVARDPGSPDAPVAGYVVDASRLRYNRLFDRPRATPRDNFFSLLKQVIALFPNARFAGDREQLAAGGLPTYLDLPELEARLLKAAT